MLAIFHTLGLTMALFSVSFIAPVLAAIVYRDGMLGTFVAAGLATAAFGLAVAALTRPFRRELKARDGFALVVLTWLGMCVSAAFALFFALPRLDFAGAFFEATSGITTTGATVLVGLDNLAPSIHIWRHTLHLLGGLGIIVLAVAILPLLGVGGMQLYKAETPGPMKDEKLTPRITETAKRLWVTYASLTVIAILSLHLAGMSWLDAICNAFSAMSTGGFSTHDASIGYYKSPLIEALLIVFMIAACLNFARHFLVARRISLQPHWQDPETRAVLVLLASSILLITVLLIGSDTYPHPLVALRHAAFSVVSIATTTGFVTEDYERWPIFAPVFMLFLGCITAGTGSTGGGIKMFRTLVLWRQSMRELKLLVHPSAVLPVRIGGQVIQERVAASVLAFIFLYFATIAAFTFALLLTGLSLPTAFSASVACVNSIGPGLEVVGPSGNFAHFDTVQLLLCSSAMLLGRLEIFTVLLLFTPTFWRR
ncbi:MAG: potassium transporter TrkG [Steroidobacteraceae bacterium]